MNATTLTKGREKTGGRQKGTPNKVTRLLKDDILEACATAHPEGRVGYLRQQAQENPAAFMTLLGKVLPSATEHSGPDGEAIPHSLTIKFG